MAQVHIQRPRLGHVIAIAERIPLPVRTTASGHILGRVHGQRHFDLGAIVPDMLS